MAPFSYCSKRKIVYLSPISTIQSICTCLLVVCSALFVDMQLSKGYVPYQGKAIEYIVSYVLFYYNFIKIVITVSIQLIHRDELTRLLNQLLSIKVSFEQFMRNDRFVDDKLLIQFKNRRFLAGAQFVILISSISSYVYRTLYLDPVLVIYCYITVIYVNLYSTLCTGIYYNGLMIVIDRFYRILISRLKFLLIIVERKVIKEHCPVLYIIKDNFEEMY